MNGTNPASVWRTHTTPEGKKYYENTVTKTTQWNIPPELEATLAQGAASNWQQVTTADGKPYWWNKATNKTTWEEPEELKNAQAARPLPEKPPQPSNDFVAGGNWRGQTYNQPPTRDDYGPPERRGHDRDRERDRPSNFNQHDNLRSNFISSTPATNEPDYRTFEEAEAAFLKMLKRIGVQPEWTWEQTMKATVKDPEYRSLKDPKDRKTAFEKFALESRQQDKEREKERMAKLREDFTKMLKSHPEIKHYTRWKTARPIIEGETIFKSAGDDTERRQLFEEYIQSLKKAHAEQEIDNRQSALDELTSILHALNLEPYTRWSDARGLLDNNERLANDDKFKSLSKSDVLTAFENHIKALERSFNDARQLQKSQKARRERQNRDKFIELLRELQSGGKIKPDTKWKDILPLIEEDDRYVAVLGQSGSTPLDLFWDLVEEEGKELKNKRNEVLDVLDDKRYEITTKTTIEEFMGVMSSDRRTAAIDPHDLKLVYQKLIEKIHYREEEDKKNAEKQRKDMADRLRSRMKRLDPPIRVSDTWEDVQPRIERLEEYTALDSDDLRRSAFDRHIQRLKEKEQEKEHDRARRSERDRDRDRDRHHDRDRRSGHSARSRTPEVDAYEAERRKATANRERSYRKASSGLSPPPGGRYETRDADRWDRGDRASGRLSAYERRDRRERDFDRESHRSFGRGDPREAPAKELDYGESGRAGSSMSTPSGTGRRRRSSGDEGDEGSARRDSKRLRRETKTPEESAGASRKEKDKAAQLEKEKTTEMEVEKEETNYKSGSEEGEIEEE